MDAFSRIIILNVGWSDDYQSGAVLGNFDYLKNGVGHEKYNFLPDVNGKFFGYVPPLGAHHRPPMPASRKGWLVFVVSKRPNHKGWFLVGWYENATFLHEYLPRPDSSSLGKDSEGNEFLHTLVADQATLIPLSLRDRPISNAHQIRTYAYLRGSGQNDPWRNRLADELLSLRAEYQNRIAANGDDETDLPVPFNPDPKRRQEIEKKAEAAVEAHFKGWVCQNRAAEKCGYDLLFVHKKTRAELHVEVKGTARDVPHFFMTQKEYLYAEQLAMNDEPRKSDQETLRPHWKLAVVHDVDRTPKVTLYTYEEMKSAFDIAPYAHHATIKVR